MSRKSHHPQTNHNLSAGRWKGPSPGKTRKKRGETPNFSFGDPSRPSQLRRPAEANPTKCQLTLQQETPRKTGKKAIKNVSSEELTEIGVKIREQYRNLGDGLKKEPRALAKALEATKAAGMTPEQTAIRGGTDGSLLTAQGLPTPNLSTGEHNPHSPLEWTSLEEMQAAVGVLVQLAVLWGEETV